MYAIKKRHHIHKTINICIMNRTCFLKVIDFFENKNFYYQVLWVVFPFHLAFCGLLNANAHWSPTADDVGKNVPGVCKLEKSDEADVF
jgi:hypothetical protein